MTVSGHHLVFKGVLKLNNLKLVVKGFLAKPQTVIMSGKKVKLQGFVQFVPEGILHKNKIISNKLAESFDEALVELVESDLAQAEAIEYFTLAHHRYIVRPRSKMNGLSAKKNLNELASKF